MFIDLVGSTGLSGRLDPEEMSELVMKTLEREPRRRIQSADELRRALKRLLLSHARSPEEIDLSSYLGALYSDEIAQEAERDGVPPASEAKTSPAISTEDMTASAEGEVTKVPK